MNEIRQLLKVSGDVHVTESEQQESGKLLVEFEEAGAAYMDLLVDDDEVESYEANVICQIQLLQASSMKYTTDCMLLRKQTVFGL